MDNTLYSGHGWDIRLEEAALPDGRIKATARIHACDTAHILAFPEPGTILMLHEYRPFYGEWVWMLPSGKVDKEPDVLVAAQRELREETGYRAGRIRPYFTARHTERIVYRCHVFLAADLTKDPLPQDADELIEVHALPVDEALAKVLGMETVHTASALALLRYVHERPNI